MEIVEECEPMSPLSPATLSFLMDSSVQADNHKGLGAGQAVEAQPDLGLNVCSLMKKGGEQPQQDSNNIVEPSSGSGTKSCGAGQVLEPQPDLGLTACSLMKKKGGEQPQQDSSIIVEPSRGSGTRSCGETSNQGRLDDRLVVEPP